MATILTLAVIGGQMPTSALTLSAAPGAQAVEILAFAPLEESTLNQIVPLGTALESLNLAPTLTATIAVAVEEKPIDNAILPEEPITQVPAPQIVALPEATTLLQTAFKPTKLTFKNPQTLESNMPTQSTVDVPVAWVATPEYSGETAGVYTFTAVLSEEYSLAQNLIMPAITVTVESGAPQLFGPRSLPEYNIDDIKAINANIASNTSLTTSLTWGVGNESGTVNPNWFQVTWSTDIKNKRIIEVKIPSSGLTGGLDFTGLTALKKLDCNSNEIESLKVSGLTELTYLGFKYNDISSIDLTGLTSLETLNCRNNALYSLDLPVLTKLTSLNCASTQISELDLSKHTELTELSCEENQLSFLDLSKITKLTTFSGDSQRIELEMNEIALYDYEANILFNSPKFEIGEFTYSGGKLKSTTDFYEFTEFSAETGLQGKKLSGYLDLVFHLDDPIYNAGDIAVINKIIDDNDLKWERAPANGDTIPADWSDGIGWSSSKKNKRVCTLFLNNKGLTGNLTGLTGLTALAELYCSGNQLSSINLTGLTSLAYLNCNYNQLSSLNLAGLTALNYFYGVGQTPELTMQGNNTIGYEAAISFKNPTFNSDFITYSNGRLKVVNDDEESVGFSEQTGLQDIVLSGELFFNFPLTKPTYNAGDIAVINQIITNNNLKWEPAHADGKTIPEDWESITWSDRKTNRRVVTLDLEHQGLTGHIDLTGLDGINTIALANNQLSSLNLSGLVMLRTIECYSNQLSSLNLSGLVMLRTIECYSNQLSSLNLTGLTSLIQLNCGDNQLSSLNLTGLTSLIQLNCGDNQLSSLNLSGLEKLIYLSCGRNQLSSLDLSGLVALIDLDCNDNYLSSLDLSGLANFGRLFAENQKPALTLSGNAANGYELDILLNNPTLGDTSINYLNGKLKTANSNLLSTSFTAETGKAGHLLEGVFTLNYTTIGSGEDESASSSSNQGGGSSSNQGGGSSSNQGGGSSSNQGGGSSSNQGGGSSSNQGGGSSSNQGTGSSSKPGTSSSSKQGTGSSSASTIANLPTKHIFAKGETISWTPAITGGAWQFDEDFLTMQQTGDTVTFTAKKVGETIIKYTVNGIEHTITLIIPDENAPLAQKKGKALIYVLMGIAALACALGLVTVLLKRKRMRK